jgi:hypothetical protein
MALTSDLVAQLQALPSDCGPGPNDRLCDEADYSRLLSDVLAGKPPGGVWLFAYGSLMWRRPVWMKNAGGRRCADTIANSASGSAAFAARPNVPG